MRKLDPLCCLIVALVLLFAGAVRADAQNDGRRHSFWAGFGLGYGSASFSCDTCHSDPWLGGYDFYFTGGETFSPHVRVGAELRRWFHWLKRGILPSSGTVTVLLSYYPRVRGGPLVEIGCGRSWYDLGKPIESFSSDATYASGTGWGCTAGVGWELRSFTPRVTFAYGSGKRLQAPDGATMTTGWKQNVLLVEAGYRTP
jgi:hypothetical protein